MDERFNMQRDLIAELDDNRQILARLAQPKRVKDRIEPKFLASLALARKIVEIDRELIEDEVVLPQIYLDGMVKAKEIMTRMWDFVTTHVPALTLEHVNPFKPPIPIIQKDKIPEIQINDDDEAFGGADPFAASSIVQNEETAPNAKPPTGTLPKVPRYMPFIPMTNQPQHPTNLNVPKLSNDRINDNTGDATIPIALYNDVKKQLQIQAEQFANLQGFILNFMANNANNASNANRYDNGQQGERVENEIRAGAYSSRIKLPALELPTFSGDIKTYKAFKAQFRRMVDSALSSLTDRLIMLRSKLHQAPHLAIDQLVDTDENYEKAWKVLDAYYDNNIQHVENILKNFLDIPKVHQDDTESIYNLVNGFETLVANTRELKFDTTTVYIFHAKARMSDYLRTKWVSLRDPKATHFPTHEEFVEFMRREYQISLSRGDQASGNNKKIQAKTHVTQQSDTGSRKPPRCFICDKDHIVIDCPTFVGSKDREALLRQHKLCIFCARHRFDFKNPCKKKTSLSCEICAGQHITEVHPAGKVAATTYLSETLGEKKFNKIFLPTAIANVTSDYGVKISVRCLLDQCSDHTYICEDLAQKLKLASENADVSISGVGEITSKAHAMTSFQLIMDEATQKTIEVKAIIVKNVTGMLPSVLGSVEIRDNKRVLADPLYNEPSHIPILLGSDILPWLYREGVEMKNGLLYQNSVFGWIVSGNEGTGLDKFSQFASTYVATVEIDKKLDSEIDQRFWDLSIHKKMPEDETKEKPALRRSRRDLKKVASVSLVTIALLTWLAFTQATNGLKIQSLTSGVHLTELANVSIKAFDFDFKVKTNLNFTADIMQIGNITSDFSAFCDSITDEKYAHLKLHCEEVKETVFKEAKTIKIGMMAAYHLPSRVRRNLLGVLAKPIGKVVLKHGMSIALAAGVAYQTYETIRLENALEEVQRKIVRVSTLLTNITELEYEAVDNELMVLLNRQNEILLEAKINDLATHTQALVSEIQFRHQNILLSTPLDALETYLDSINDKLMVFTLPSLPVKTDIFSLNPATKSIEDDMVVLKYRIPMVRQEKYREYAFISVPTPDQHAIVFRNDKLVQKIALSADNSSCFFPLEETKAFENIYQDVRITKPDSCLTAFIKPNSTDALVSNCVSRSTAQLTEEVFLLREDLAVVYKKDDSEVIISCEHNVTEKIWTPVSLINFPDCEIHAANTIVAANRLGEVMVQRPAEINNISFEPLEMTELQHATQSPELIALKKELNTELKSLQREPGLDWIGPSLAAGAASFIVLLGIMLWRILSSRAARTAHPSPILTMKERKTSWMTAQTNE